MGALMEKERVNAKEQEREKKTTEAPPSRQVSEQEEVDLDSSMSEIRKGLQIKKGAQMNLPELRASNRKVYSIFQQWDKNRDGSLMKEELCGVLKVLNPIFTDIELDALFKAADVDRNGEIDFYEFCDWLFDQQS